MAFVSYKMVESWNVKELVKVVLYTLTRIIDPEWWVISNYLFRIIIVRNITFHDKA